jgi:enamine deaminase RidA (YjgF/YER057c/UK114 family)
MSEIENRIKNLGLVLPEVSAPLAAYIPAKKTGHVIFTAGQLPLLKGELICKGLLGQAVDIKLLITFVLLRYLLNKNTIDEIHVVIKIGNSRAIKI